MGIQTFTPASIIKSVQSGTTAASGSVTINAVNVSKTVIYSKSKGSSGTVAATGSVTLTHQSTYSSDTYGTGTDFPTGGTGSSSSHQAGPSLSGNLTGGTTSLTVKEYSATLTNSTTINCDGPVEWQVIEYV